MIHIHPDSVVMKGRCGLIEILPSQCPDNVLHILTCHTHVRSTGKRCSRHGHLRRRPLDGCEIICGISLIGRIAPLWCNSSDVD